MQTPSLLSGARAGRWSVRGLALLAPALLLAGALMLVPLAGIIGQSLQIDGHWSLANYSELTGDGGRVFRLLILRSLGIALVSTAIILALAYPTAYFIARHAGSTAGVWIMLITIPFWTSYLLRVFAFKIILGYNGVINSGLIELGLTEAPLDWLLYSQAAVVITLVHSWAPFAVLPIYVSLQRMDASLLEAASDLGDTRLRRFWHVTLPLSVPGITAASLMVFIPIVGDFVTPSLVGGTAGMMVGNYISEIFTQGGNVSLGSAMSVATMTVIALLVALYLGVLNRAVPRAGGAA